VLPRWLKHEKIHSLRSSVRNAAAAAAVTADVVVLVVLVDRECHHTVNVNSTNHIVRPVLPVHRDHPDRLVVADNRVCGALTEHPVRFTITVITNANAFNAPVVHQVNPDRMVGRAKLADPEHPVAQAVRLAVANRDPEVLLEMSVHQAVPEATAPQVVRDRMHSVAPVDQGHKVHLDRLALAVKTVVQVVPAFLAIRAQWALQDKLDFLERPASRANLAKTAVMVNQVTMPNTAIVHRVLPLPRSSRPGSRLLPTIKQQPQLVLLPVNRSVSRLDEDRGDAARRLCTMHVLMKNDA